jgi:polyisoprenoid-binding protein YceI
MEENYQIRKLIINKANTVVSSLSKTQLPIRNGGVCMNFKFLSLSLLVMLVAVDPQISCAQERSIDTARSKLTVRAFKSGLFSGFADNHEIQAPMTSGVIDEAAGRVKFTVESGKMKVLDPQMKPARRQEVQDRMLGPEVLDSTRFPEITFESSSVEHSGDSYVVHGKLLLHGVTKPVDVNVRSEGGAYRGTCTLKQHEFGIEPISIAGGTVKVKDELKIEFDIRVAH